MSGWSAVVESYRHRILPTEDNPSTKRKISVIATLATTSAVWNGLKLNRFLRSGSTVINRLHSGTDPV